MISKKEVILMRFISNDPESKGFVNVLDIRFFRVGDYRRKEVTYEVAMKLHGNRPIQYIEELHLYVIEDIYCLWNAAKEWEKVYNMSPLFDENPRVQRITCNNFKWKLSDIDKIPREKEIILD